MHATFILSVLTLALSVTARPSLVRVRQNADDAANIKAALDLNGQFKNAKDGDACTAGVTSCVGDQLGQCVNGKVLATACAPGTICRALPLTSGTGTTIACTTQADFDQRTGGQGGAEAPPSPAGGAGANNAGAGANNNGAGANNNGAGGDPATSLTLDPSVIAKGFATDGQNPPVDGQSPSLTSTNNFINFCVGKTITDGKQVKEGSCDPCPIGDIPSTKNMPSAKFLFPPNNDASLKASTPFTVKLNIQGMQTGNFVNAATNYFAAPQQLNAQGQVIGHTHIVIEKMTDIAATTPLDPLDFDFFKGINEPAANGVATAAVDDGLAAGAYRICTINSSSNHQPVIVPIAQHGSLDDCSYFTVN